MLYYVQTTRGDNRDSDWFPVVTSTDRNEVIKAVEQQRYYDSLGHHKWEYIVEIYNDCNDAEYFWFWMDENNDPYPDDCFSLNDDCSNLP